MFHNLGTLFNHREQRSWWAGSKNSWSPRTSFTLSRRMSFETFGVLDIIVLIRTFLSFTLEVELTGRWPWRGKH